MHNEQTRKRQHNVKRKDAACPECHGLRHTIAAGTKCAGCGRERDTKVCPGCAGMPERVVGKTCSECGTPAGKNPEYPHGPRRTSSSGWGVL